MRSLALALGLGGLLLTTASARPCSLCGNPQTTATLREQFQSARLVVFGTVEKSRLGAGGTGTSEVQIDSVLKSDPALGERKRIEVPRYVPVEAGRKPRYLIFCDVVEGRIDAPLGVPARSTDLAEYVRGAGALSPTDRSKALEYFFRYLDSDDPDIAQDAYLEFARANDQEVGQVARKLTPARLRRLIESPQTPTNRVGLYAFLLGACGGDAEATFLRALIERPTERTAGALDGILAGYVQLRPREGWELVQGLVKNPSRPFQERLAVFHTLRFLHGWKGNDLRRELLAALKLMLDQGDIADVAIEDLRKWGWWDLTTEVLGQYGKKSHDAPIMKQAIVRYALCSPQPEATRFIAERRRVEPTLVKDVEDLLQLDQPKQK